MPRSRNPFQMECKNGRCKRVFTTKRGYDQHVAENFSRCTVCPYCDKECHNLARRRVHDRKCTMKTRAEDSPTSALEKRLQKLETTVSVLTEANKVLRQDLQREVEFNQKMHYEACERDMKMRKLGRHLLALQKENDELGTRFALLRDFQDLRDEVHSTAPAPAPAPTPAPKPKPKPKLKPPPTPKFYGLPWCSDEKANMLVAEGYTIMKKNLYGGVRPCNRHEVKSPSGRPMESWLKLMDSGVYEYNQHMSWLLSEPNNNGWKRTAKACKSKYEGAIAVLKKVGFEQEIAAQMKVLEDAAKERETRKVVLIC